MVVGPARPDSPSHTAEPAQINRSDHLIPRPHRR